MSISVKQRCLIGLYKIERLHQSVYESLSGSERNKDIKAIMERLSRLEKKHADLWGEMLLLNHTRAPKGHSRFSKFLILLSKRVLGLAITIKIIEHVESDSYQQFIKVSKSIVLTKKEERIINEIRKSEETEESRLENNVANYGTFLKNVKDIMFGMNDGLVELLAVAVGFAAALRTPLLIFIAGFIVAISGTLSMAAGAYLSTDYEKSIKSKIMQKSNQKSALESGFYVGIFYFIGSLFPLAPFAIGYSGYMGIVMSIVFTAIVLTFTSSMIAIASDKSIARAVSKTLLISLSVAAITILLGSYVRATFHITV